MSASILRRAFGSAVALGLLASGRAFAADASAVVSYNAGTNRFQFSAYTNAAVALGMPQTNTGFGFVTTPFNNPFSKNDVVSVGLGGQLTLQLSNRAVPVANAPEIGVFTFQQFVQSSSGGTDSGPTLFYPSIQATVDVSADGQNWVSLNNGNLIAFNIPANAFQDAAATAPSSYFQPFIGSVSSLANEGSLGATLAAYNGSAGGTWLDISGTGLASVDYIRFSVPSTDAFSFQLDGVTVSSDATGPAVPEPTALAAIPVIAAFHLRRRRSQI
jgi:hypothetical protein